MKKIFSWVLFLGLIITVPCPAYADITTGLVLYYPFDEDEGGIVTDQSGLGNDGTVLNNVTFNPTGKVQGAFDFGGGTDDFIDVPKNGSLNLGNQLTISAWYKVSDTNQRIIMEWKDVVTVPAVHVGANIAGGQWQPSPSHPGANGGTGAHLVSTDGNNQTNVISTQDQIVNEWHHLAITYDGNTGIAKVYIDATVANSANLGLFVPQTSFGFRIGKFITIPSLNWLGSLDEVRLYNRVLSNTDIVELFEFDPNMAPPDITTGLVLYYPFDEDEGGIVTDQSGLGNDGTVLNNVTFNPTGKVQGAFDFGGGIDDFIDVPNNGSLNLGNQLTISAWYKVSDTNQRIIMEWKDVVTVPAVHVGANITGGQWQPSPSHPGANGGTGAHLVSTDGNNQTNVISTQDQTMNEWHHLAIIYDGNTGIAKVYIDGAVANSANLGLFVPQTSFGFRIGKFITIPSLNWLGSLDEVRLYNRVLSNTDIVKLFEFDPSTAPIADAGLDQIARQGDDVFLDGSGSFDPDGDTPITYNWQFVSKPVGSVASLNDANSVNPSFSPDLIGDYIIELKVTDALGALSDPDTITVAAIVAPSFEVGISYQDFEDLNGTPKSPADSPGGLPQYCFGFNKANANRSTEQAYNSSYACKVINTTNWGGIGVPSQVQTYNVNFIPKCHDRLTFWIYALPSNNGNNDVGVKFFDKSNYSSGTEVFTSQDAIFQQWTELTVMFSDLPADPVDPADPPAFDFNNIDKIEFVNFWPGIYYFDDIKVTSSSTFPENLACMEAEYIVASQEDDPMEPAYGAINNVFTAGIFDYIVPRENGLAILGLIRTSEMLNDPTYLAQAQLAADYLVKIQDNIDAPNINLSPMYRNQDGGWYNQYELLDVQMLDGEAKSPTQTAEVMLAFYNLGFDTADSLRKKAMKQGAKFLLDLINKSGPDDDLIAGGKNADNNIETWRWSSDNAFGYLALRAAENWAVQEGDMANATLFHDAANEIINGINVYLYTNSPTSNPNNPNNCPDDDNVWYVAIDENSHAQCPDGREWIQYAPQMLDIPATGVGDPLVGDWIQKHLQKIGGDESGAVVQNDTFLIDRKSPGFSFQATLAWQDLNQSIRSDAAKNWVYQSGLRLTKPEGGWIDWIEHYPPKTASITIYPDRTFVSYPFDYAVDLNTTTLKDNALAGNNANDADNVEIWDSNSQAFTIHYYDGTEWKDDSTGMTSDVILQPGMAFFYRNKSGSSFQWIENLKYSILPAEKNQVTILQGDNYIANPFGKPSIHVQNAQFNDFAMTGDQILVFNPNPIIQDYETLTYNGSEWIEDATGNVSNEALDPGEGFIYRTIATGPNTWDEIVRAEDFEKFIDTSFYSIASFSGGYNFNIPQTLNGNTPSGVNINVDLSQSDTFVTFNDVLTQGHTEVSVSPSGPPTPSGFQISGMNYYDIITTSTFTGTIEVCINYDDSGLSSEDEDNLRLLHFEGSAWVDVTNLPNDTLNNIVCGDVNSLSPFALFISLNSRPVSNAGDDQTVECTGPNGADISLDASGSSDPDGDSLTYAWNGPFGQVQGVSPIVTLPLGVHNIELIVDDGNGGTDTDIVQVTVKDTTSPDLGLSVDPDMLWPPNHKMIQIIPTFTVSDICDSDPQVELTLITMNEGDTTNTFDPNLDEEEEGNTKDDIQVDVDGNVFLRAERAGKSDGRIYTITYTATDASGNSIDASATVTVPHNQ